MHLNLPGLSRHPTCIPSRTLWQAPHPSFYIINSRWPFKIRSCRKPYLIKSWMNIRWLSTHRDSTVSSSLSKMKIWQKQSCPFKETSKNCKDCRKAIRKPFKNWLSTSRLCKLRILTTSLNQLMVVPVSHHIRHSLRKTNTRWWWWLVLAPKKSFIKDNSQASKKWLKESWCKKVF